MPVGKKSGGADEAEAAQDAGERAVSRPAPAEVPVPGFASNKQQWHGAWQAPWRRSMARPEWAAKAGKSAADFAQVGLCDRLHI